MNELNLSPTLFTIFTGLIEERVGLAYTPVDKPIFESKLAACVLDAGFESPLDYYYFLRYDDPGGVQFQALVQALVVHETFFFREFSSLRAAIDAFVKPLVAAGRRARLWCAASSTGEEPLSAAMLLAELGLLDQVVITASDISAAALARAQRGVFSPRAVRDRLPTCARDHLTQDAHGYRVSERLIAAVNWRQVNLMDDSAVAALGEMDVILCRNVLIYFREETAHQVVTRLRRSLRPNGALVVGVSESLMRFHVGLSCEEYGGAFLYRRTET